MKDTLIEIKNNLQGYNSRVNEAKNRINDSEHKETKNNHAEQQEEKKNTKNEDSLSSLCCNFELSNIHIMGVPEEKWKSKKSKIYLNK